MGDASDARARLARVTPFPPRLDDPDHMQAVLAMSGRWGAFSFTVKRPGTQGGGQFGGVQAECFFHRKNSRTGCRKFVRIAGPTFEARRLALLTA
eukprot:2004918-Alexandrium_andersonii.AAC.1